MKGVKHLVLAIGLGMSVGPSYADTFQTIDQKSEVVQPAQVIQSWMQPTVVRKTSLKDDNGDVSVKEEPLIQERHEKVMIPVVKEESTTTVSQTGPKTVTRVAARSYSSGACARRKVAYHRSAHRAVAYRGSVASTTSSQTVQHTQRTVEEPVIMERRDPALDLQ